MELQLDSYIGVWVCGDTRTVWIGASWGDEGVLVVSMNEMGVIAGGAMDGRSAATPLVTLWVGWVDGTSGS